MSVSPVLVTARNYQAQLARAERQATQRLINSYVRSWNRLEALLNALLLEIGQNTPTRGQLTRMARYQALMDQITAELAALQALTGNEIEAAGALVSVGERAARELIAMNFGRAGVAAMLNVLPKDAIQTLLGFLDPTGPLYDRLRMLTGVNAQYVANALIEGITLGFNPRKIARLVRDAFGRGLADALRFVRTAQLWVYREASRASMVANQSVLQGWVWHATFDDRVCMACIAKHGSIHPVDEILQGHHNCRCVGIPLVIGFDSPVDQTGEEWFRKQSEILQRELMGKGKYDAWKSGAFEFSNLAGTHTDPVYGEMIIERSLKDLLANVLQ